LDRFWKKAHGNVGRERRISGGYQRQLLALPCKSKESMLRAGLVWTIVVPGQKGELDGSAFSLELHGTNYRA
jgi:hypothetical protein